MTISGSLVKSCGDLLRPDGTHTVLRPFHVTDPAREGDADGRTARIIDRVLSLDPDALEEELRGAVNALQSRHDDVDAILERRFDELNASRGGRLDVSGKQARLIGAFFSEGYSIEAAALFNPSVVPHFDQVGVTEGDLRIILSLRGIGEGHISSLIFQTGIWHADGSATLDPSGPRATGPATELPPRDGTKRTAELTFPDVPIGERVIYPFLPSQGRGIEDARFCRFVEDDGAADYRCTFTAFDGTETRQSIFQTQDFRCVTGCWLDGALAFRKGAAWFPRRIGGRYHMLGRLDEESIYLLSSDDPYARAILDDQRILLVMNTAFGTAGDLPFDMAHLRHPAAYSIEEQAEEGLRRSARSAFALKITPFLKASLNVAMQDRSKRKVDPDAVAPAHALLGRGRAARRQGRRSGDRARAPPDPPHGAPGRRGDASSRTTTGEGGEALARPGRLRAGERHRRFVPMGQLRPAPLRRGRRSIRNRAGTPACCAPASSKARSWSAPGSMTTRRSSSRDFPLRGALSTSPTDSPRR